MNQIEITQKPVIKHRLHEVGASVTSRIEALNLENLVATDETIQSLKTLRAELNKELSEFEAQRKNIKEAVSGPYMDFEAAYKTEISEKYKYAGDILKDKINAFEIRIKEEKQAEIEGYFNELCLSEQIDFVKFNQVGITVNLSTSLKKYREACNDFIQKVKDDVKLIESDQYAVEIMAEYKLHLNASKAITSVRERKDREKAEAERRKMELVAKREGKLRALTMVFNQMAHCFYFVQDDSINISQSDIENLPEAEWRSRLEELTFNIESFRESLAPKPEEKPQAAPEPLKAPVQVPTQQNLPEIKDETTHTAAFMVVDTLPRLIELSQFLKQNNYKYENIDLNKIQ